MRFIWVTLVLVSSAWGQNEAALKAYFEGKTVMVKLDMPATKDGVDIRPKGEPKVDFKSYSSRIRQYGVSLHNGDSVTVTTVRVKDKNIEFQLGGGGYGVFGDDTGSVALSTSVPKTSREKDLERDISHEMNPRVKDSMQRELDRLRDRRNREEARLRAEKAALEQDKSVEVAQKRLSAGSRFNIVYPDKYLKETIPSPQEVMLILSDYVDFGRMSPVPASKSGSQQKKGKGQVLARGLTLGQVMGIYGIPVRSREHAEGNLSVVTNTFQSPTEVIEVDFVKDVVVDYRIRPR
jgi:hypothetical protein